MKPRKQDRTAFWLNIKYQNWIWYHIFWECHFMKTCSAHSPHKIQKSEGSMQFLYHRSLMIVLAPFFSLALPEWHDCPFFGGLYLDDGSRSPSSALPFFKTGRWRWQFRMIFPLAFFQDETLTLTGDSMDAQLHFLGTCSGKLCSGQYRTVSHGSRIENTGVNVFFYIKQSVARGRIKGSQQSDQRLNGNYPPRAFIYGRAMAWPHFIYIYIYLNIRIMG